MVNWIVHTPRALEIGNIRTKVKVTVTENASQNCENDFAKQSNENIFEMFCQMMGFNLEVFTLELIENCFHNFRYIFVTVTLTLNPRSPISRRIVFWIQIFYIPSFSSKGSLKTDIHYRT